MSTIGDWGSSRDRADLDDWITREPDIENDEPTEPEEEDAVITPSGPLGAYTSASFGSKHLGEFRGENNETEALEAIAEEMRRTHFWPTVWSISDHGNAHVIEDFYKRFETGV